MVIIGVLGVVLVIVVISLMRCSTEANTMADELLEDIRKEKL